MFAMEYMDIHLRVPVPHRLFILVILAGDQVGDWLC